ncbi:hypothetical protein [Fictibacillus norfolkensis]|uniref:Uncharacterized protein n=1 Tax=Fictibacillus norfolkensis TaxID=2762233 RepID=A0ABR8SMU9_9BACL|nr:hypothetical protein [Fictibacillus norfolkensis]MBD7964796.1 hypothetical protein [Fictibacillus norfolkensis]
MELSLPESVKKYYWYLFPITMILMTLNAAFYGNELQYFGYYELEDLGRIIFILLIKAFESALITILLIWLYTKMKSGYKNP